MKDRVVFSAKALKYGRLFEIVQCKDGRFDAVIYENVETEEPVLFGSRNSCQTYQQAFSFLVANGLNKEFQDFLNKKPV